MHLKQLLTQCAGFGGTNAHAIIESFGDVHKHEIVALQAASEPTGYFVPFTFSATSETSLRALVELYRKYLASTEKLDLRRLAYTLGCRRSPFAYKTTFSATSRLDLISKIERSISDNTNALGARSVTKLPSILGIFTGQGAQWPKMGAELVRSSTFVRGIIEELDCSLASLPVADRPDWTIMGELEKDSRISRLDEAAVAQPVVNAVQIVLVNLLRRAGVRFRAILGHSSGEIAAAYAAGFIGQKDAIRIAYYRGFHSKLAKGLSGQQGGMLAVGTSLEDAEEFCSLEDFQGRIVVAASNSPTSVTLSGDIDAIEEAKALFEEENKFVRSLRVDKAYHSHHMLAAAKPFLGSLKACNIEVLTPIDSPTWFSTVHRGTTVDGTFALDGQYWVDNLNSTVLFSQALEDALEKSGPFDSAIEVGPHAALKGPACDVINKCTSGIIPYTGTLSRGKSDIESFANSLGSLWTNAGAMAVDFEGLQNAVYDDTENIVQLHELPSYPWTHDRVLWSESRYTRLLRLQEGSFHDILGTRTPDGTEEEWRWRNILSSKELPWLSDHGLQGQTVFPATGYISFAMEAGMQIAGHSGVQLLELTELSIRKAIAIDETNGTETQVSLTRIVRTDGEVTALFACYSAVSKDSSQLALNAIGKLRVQLGTPIDEILAPRASPSHGMVPVSPEHFFNEVDKIGYNYGPTFRGIKKLERKLGESRGTIRGPANNETGTTLLFHPGMLDAALQGMLCGFSSPGDGRLWSLHAPSTIRRVTLLPALCASKMTPEVYFDCAVTDVSYNKLTGDVEVFQSDTGYKSIAVEGVSFIPFSAATRTDDRHLFAYNTWGIEEPDGDLALGGVRATALEIEKAFDAERVAYYYLRMLRENVTVSERTTLQLPDHHEALFDYADHIWSQVQRGGHLYVKPEWENDSYDKVCSIMDR